jgi:4-hydroxy-3-methylbut-2-enyl diphosphate reductase
VAERAGAGRAILVPKVSEMDFSVMDGVRTVGITAGASAPESLVQEVLAELSARFALQIEERQVTQEDVIFKLPYPLA